MNVGLLRVDYSRAELALLDDLLAAPIARQTALLDVLDGDGLYRIQCLVHDGFDRRSEQDVALKKVVDDMVRRRYPRGWPSPGSAIEPESIPQVRR